MLISAIELNSMEVGHRFQKNEEGLQTPRVLQCSILYVIEHSKSWPNAHLLHVTVTCSKDMIDNTVENVS